MLRHLHVRNLAVIEEASVEFTLGLNVVTGETGAGKSLVVDSLALLSGARASSDLIRTGAETLSVTGVFRPSGSRWQTLLEDSGIHSEGDEIHVRREVSRSGRNRVFVEDHPVTLRLLTDLAPDLLRIHGQREELGLVDPELQREWLDRLGLLLEGERAREVLDSVATAFDHHQAAAERLIALTSDSRARLERIDLLRYQAAEIAGAGLRSGEEDDLRSQRSVLRHAEVIGEALTLGANLLLEDEDSVGSQLARVSRAVERISSFDPEAGAWTLELEELRVRAEDLGSTLRSRQDDIDADPNRLNGIEDRLALIERLLKKYGSTTALVLEHERAAREELLQLEGGQESADTLRRDVDEKLEIYSRAAAKLARSRRAWAQELVTRMHVELPELALPSATLGVRFETRSKSSSPLHLEGEPVEFHRWGIESVVFELSSNPGEAPRALAKVASGGELSRIYLALQLATGAGAAGEHSEKSSAKGTSGGRSKAATAESALRAEAASLRTVLVFDEIDTGVGGAEAASIGTKMKMLATGGQVLAVTHLPQVACSGDHHVKVEKLVSAGRTSVIVRSLSGVDRVEELARMLGGVEITEVTRRHARELLGLDPSGKRRGLRSV